MDSSNALAGKQCPCSCQRSSLPPPTPPELQADHHALVPVGAVTPQPAEALLNYFPVQIEPGQQAFVYSVEFRPPFTVPAGLLQPPPPPMTNGSQEENQACA